jgi:hypothetical protein
MLAVHAAPAPVPKADRAAAVRGAAWLGAQAPGSAGGVEADAVVALVAAHRAPGSHLAALRRLAPTYAVAPGPAAKVALAVEAAGQNPRCFGGVDVVHPIQQGYAAGIYGATIWDDALSIAALAGAEEHVPPAAVRALRRARAGGGWSFSLTGGTDDADSTGLALMALRAAGARPGDPDLKAGASWLLAHRADDGGWSGAAGGGASDADSTALAIRGLVAAGRTVPPSATSALRRLQASDGSFSATAASAGSRILATNDAVPALMRVTLPVRTRSAPGHVC